MNFILIYLMEIMFGPSLKFRTPVREAAASRHHGSPIKVFLLTPSDHRGNMVPRCSSGSLDSSPIMPRGMRIMKIPVRVRFPENVYQIENFIL